MDARRIQVHKYGAPSVLAPEPYEPKPPGRGQVQIAVEAVGINFADLLQRMGLYQAAPKPPFVPGFEVAGRIAAVGEGVVGVKEGDKVAAVTGFGGYQTHVNAPAEGLFPVGDMTMEEAAAFPTVYLTAWEALHGMGRVREGERVLIHGGAGGVGLAAVTLARHLGCEVYATCGSPEKVAFLERPVKQGGAGVDRAFDYRAEPWRPQLEAALGDGRAGKVDLVLESQGGKNLKESQKALRPRGRVVVYGAQEVAPSSGVPRSGAPHSGQGGVTRRFRCARWPCAPRRRGRPARPWPSGGPVRGTRSAPRRPCRRPRGAGCRGSPGWSARRRPT